MHTFWSSRHSRTLDGDQYKGCVEDSNCYTILHGRAADVLEKV